MKYRMKLSNESIKNMLNKYFIIEIFQFYNDYWIILFAMMDN
jgi:hypothetical protein